ncbi:MAG: hypothetical protein WAN94_16880 [Pseudolabrys sp.]
MPMDIVPLGPGFAVELRGVKIAEIASDGAAYSAVRGAFEEHSILVFAVRKWTMSLNSPSHAASVRLK